MCFQQIFQSRQAGWTAPNYCDLHFFGSQLSLQSSRNPHEVRIEKKLAWIESSASMLYIRSTDIADSAETICTTRALTLLRMKQFYCYAK